jgi:hypothetical protein
MDLSTTLGGIHADLFAPPKESSWALLSDPGSAEPVGQSDEERRLERPGRAHSGPDLDHSDDRPGPSKRTRVHSPIPEAMPTVGYTTAQLEEARSARMLVASVMDDRRVEVMFQL